jgi:hypothetical protein
VIRDASFSRSERSQSCCEEGRDYNTRNHTVKRDEQREIVGSTQGVTQGQRRDPNAITGRPSARSERTGAGLRDKTVLMRPTNGNEREIKRRVDLKAQGIADGTGSWDSVIVEMKISVPFVMSASEENFLEEYVRRVKGHPLWK